MKTKLTSILVFLCFTVTVFAQKRTIPTDTTVVTNHTTTIKGKKINYTAYTGTQPVWDKEGEPKGRRNIVKRTLQVPPDGSSTK